MYGFCNRNAPRLAGPARGSGYTKVESLCSNMSSAQALRDFISERLTAAATEIFSEFEKTIVQYEEEIDRQRRLLDISWKPQICLRRIELPQDDVWKEEDVSSDQQLWNQERDSSLEQEEPEPLQVNQEDCVRQNQQSFVTKQEMDTLMMTSVYQERDQSEPELSRDQFLPQNLPEAENQNQEGSSSEDLESTKEQEIKPTQGSETRDDRDHLDDPKLEGSRKAHTGGKPFTCLTCGKVCNFRSNYIRHIKVHKPKNSSSSQTCGENVTRADEKTCRHCRKSFSQTFDLLSHMITHTGEKTFTCLTCGKVCNFRSNYIRHIKAHKPKNSSSSQTCGENMTRADEKTSLSHTSDVPPHTITHTGVEPLTCKSCGKSFGQKADLLSHVRTHTGEKPFTCLTCGKVCFYRSDYIRHLKTHTLKKAFSSQACGKKTHKSLFNKDTTAHSDRKTASALVSHTGAKPFVCAICKKSFTRRTTLGYHMRIHTGEKPFTCQTCGKAYRLKQDLVGHTKTHTGKKPFTCQTCGKTFKRSDGVVSHMITHTGEKPFGCEICKKTFTQKASLNRHMRIHTGEKPFTCQTCGKSYRQKRDLVSHMRTHTGEEPVKPAETA